MSITGYPLEDASIAAVKIIASGTAYGVGVDVNVASAGFPFDPGGLGRTFNVTKLKNTAITGNIGTKEIISASRQLALSLASKLYAQSDSIETLIGCALGQSSTPVTVVGSTKRTYYSPKQIQDRYFSAGVKIGTTDTVNNPNALIYFPCNLPNTFTLEGSADNFVTCGWDCAGFDETIPIATTINKVGGYTSTDTAFTITASAGFPDSGFAILRRSGTPEIVYYRGIDATNVYNVTRGLLGTTAASIANSDSFETLAYTTAVGNVTFPTAPTFGLEDCKLYINAQSGADFAGSDLVSISKFSLSVENNLKYDVDTGSFGRSSQPKRQGFMVGFSFDEVFFSDFARQLQYLNATKLKGKLVLSSPTFANATDKVPYSVTIWLPQLQYNGDNPSNALGGAGITNATHGFEACVGPASAPTGFPTQANSQAIVVEFVNLRTTSLMA